MAYLALLTVIPKGENLLDSETVWNTHIKHIKEARGSLTQTKHFVKDHLGLDIIIIQSVQCKHSQSMDQSETRESSTVFG